MLFFIDRISTISDKYFECFTGGSWRIISSDYGDVAGVFRRLAPMLALFLAVGSILGDLVSFKFFQQTDGAVLKRIFGLLVIYSGYKMVFPPAKKS